MRESVQCSWNSQTLPADNSARSCKGITRKSAKPSKTIACSTLEDVGGRTLSPECSGIRTELAARRPGSRAPMLHYRGCDRVRPRSSRQNRNRRPNAPLNHLGWRPQRIQTSATPSALCAAHPCAAAWRDVACYRTNRASRMMIGIGTPSSQSRIERITVSLFF
jgi:hypothetical protein